MRRRLAGHVGPRVGGVVKNVLINTAGKREGRRESAVITHKADVAVGQIGGRECGGVGPGQPVRRLKCAVSDVRHRECKAAAVGIIDADDATRQRRYNRRKKDDREVAGEDG